MLGLKKKKKKKKKNYYKVTRDNMILEEDKSKVIWEGDYNTHRQVANPNT
jgi:hypothetical protein